MGPSLAVSLEQKAETFFVSVESEISVVVRQEDRVDESLAAPFDQKIEAFSRRLRSKQAVTGGFVNKNLAERRRVTNTQTDESKQIDIMCICTQTRGVRARPKYGKEIQLGVSHVAKWVNREFKGGETQTHAYTNREAKATVPSRR